MGRLRAYFDRLAHPMQDVHRGRINRSMLSCRDMAPWLSTHSPTAPRGGRWCRKAPKGECISSPAGRLYGFIQTGAFYNLEAPSTTLSGIAAVKLKNPPAVRQVNPKNLHTVGVSKLARGEDHKAREAAEWRSG